MASIRKQKTRFLKIMTNWPTFPMEILMPRIWSFKYNTVWLKPRESVAQIDARELKNIQSVVQRSQVQIPTMLQDSKDRITDHAVWVGRVVLLMLLSIRATLASRSSCMWKRERRAECVTLRCDVAWSSGCKNALGWLHLSQRKHGLFACTFPSWCTVKSPVSN